MSESNKEKVSGLDKLIDLKNKYTEKVRAEGEDLVKETFKDFFAAQPEIAALRWTQFTPYFNDGEPCVFQLNELTFKIADDGFKLPGAAETAKNDLQPSQDKANSKSENCEEDEDDWLESDDDDDDDDEDWLSCWYTRNTVGQTTTHAVSELAAKINSVEECFETLFGDGVQVTVTPDKVVVDEYNHD